ncbi:hypothetical protein F8S09_08695 [Deinococcus sp. SDU3-2]|uniref:Uncharacterized protein n=1 Tax=Deinococcus terrestris TaxID=2651870 RepID=A0A7X1NVW9_9DEIO|nr:hypothetical protein [Deinococcus terrestris]MPY66767.1 hypothetical protein [Deinococcus terrestris]
MPARIRIYGQEATFTQGCWACDDETLQAMLQALADPRATSHEAELKHARYAAGRFGGLVAVGDLWEAAPLPEPEIRMEDIAPAGRPQAAGWLSFLRKRR